MRIQKKKHRNTFFPKGKYMDVNLCTHVVGNRKIDKKKILTRLVLYKTTFFDRIWARPLHKHKPTRMVCSMNMRV